MPLGEPAHLGQGGLSIPHHGQPVPLGAAAPAQQNGPGPHRVQPGRIKVHQGVGAGGVDQTGLKPGGVDGVQHLVELLELGGYLLLAALGAGMELGIDAGQGHIGQGAVGQEDLLRLPHQEAAEAHPRVHLNVGLGHGGAVFRHRVQGQAGVHRGDGAHHVQVHQPLQLLPVHGGPEHEDLLVHKAGLPQLLGLLHAAHGKAAHPLVPEHPGQGDQAGPAAVSGEDAVQGGPRRPLPNHRHVGPDSRFFNDQLSHVDAPFCLSQVSAGAEQTRSPEYFILALRP